MKCRMLSMFLLIVSTVFSQTIKILSPNGGESYAAGQETAIRWTPDMEIWDIDLYFSCDNGTTWDFCGRESEADSLSWITPHLKQGTANALIKLRYYSPGAGLKYEDVSDGNFTVRASLPDAYEPNDDFASARPVGIGDSVVKNAFVSGVDVSEYDEDFYKVTLQGGRMTTFSVFAYHRYVLTPQIRLYDASNQLLDIGTPGSEMKVVHSGECFIRVSYDNNTPKDAVRSFKYGISIHQSDSPSITLVSPNGGESLSAGQKVLVTWQANFTFDEIRMQYSIDRGTSWRNAWYDVGDTTPFTYSWRVPHLKQRTDHALIRVFARDSANPAYDVSNGEFTILASTNDVYEPNDDFVTARAVEVGDSAVKNAMVLKNFVYPDSAGIDTFLTDVDFYALNLSSGKTVIISAPTIHRGENDFETMRMGSVVIRLYDASKNQIGMGEGSLVGYIVKSGVYYCEIASGDGSDCWNDYCLSIRQNNPVVLVSPNGGENFQFGQNVPVRWKSDSLSGIGSRFYYSINNGTSWEFASGCCYSNDSCGWYIPALKKRSDRVVFKVGADTAIQGQFDISDRTFTIQAAPDDAYEPNNDFASAYPVSVGDSVVKNASMYVYEDLPAATNSANDSGPDDDYYKVNLIGGSLVGILDWASDSVYTTQFQSVDLFDATHYFSPIAGTIGEHQSYTITQSGTYFIRKRLWSPSRVDKYGLSIKARKILTTQRVQLKTNALQFGTSPWSYRSQLIADTTKLTFTFMLNEKYSAPIPVTTMILAPKDFAPLPDEKAKVKAIGIFYNVAQFSQKTESDAVPYVDITFPYVPSELNGYPEKALAVAWQDNFSIDKWYSAPIISDTVTHQIVVHLPSLNFNLIQVYVKADLGSAADFTKTPPVLGIQANFSGQKQCMAVHFSLLAATTAELRLYDLRGKCLRKSSFAVHAGSSSIAWDFRNLANGKYIACIRAGQYHAKQSILIMK